MMDTDGKFFLGRPAAAQSDEARLLYDPADLTTHAVVVGMTGSGKTGLCLDMMEEAALNGLPALMIDPKGDITNALLHFPELRPADFEPWINADQARREGKSPAEAAAETAAQWRQGLQQWGIGSERIQALADAAQFTVYTPGSDAGVPISILASLQAPALDWDSHRELIRERITSTVSGLLGLIGLKDIDPVRSREHILLANIFEAAWSQGRDLSLSELIMQTQNPPFEKLGVFDVNTFFPERERFELSMLLNNMLAAPTFQSWIEGQPLDIDSLLYTSEGQPRHSIFYIAHLNEEERMFFVALLFAAVETWMRSQSGSTTLRALLYFDEIFGYLPPVGNPPAKEIMLRMLKQARAFGVGLVLATQNPVDVDYKALSNAGTWFVGKLQTEQDKERLLDGLAGAAGGLDRRAYDGLIAGLGKREFLLHNIHEQGPQTFRTRWAMNYLAGPLTRADIPALNALAGVGAAADPAPGQAAVPVATPAPAAAADQTSERPALGTKTRPAVPQGVMEFILPNNVTMSSAADQRERVPGELEYLGIRYRPALLAQAEVLYDARKYGLRQQSQYMALVEEPDPRGVIGWERYLKPPLDAREFEREPLAEAYFAALETPLNDARAVKRFEDDLVDWLYRNMEMPVRANEKLDVYAGPDVSEEAFYEMCAAAAEERLEAAVEKLAAAHEKQKRRLEDKLDREERELREDEAEYDRRKREEAVGHAETLIGLFTKRRRSLSSSLSKRRMTERAREEVEESEEAIEEYREELDALAEELAEDIEELEAEWREVAETVSEIGVRPYKKDIHMALLGVAWLPYYVVETERGRTTELPAFRTS